MINEYDNAIEDAHNWLLLYANELSKRGRLDDGSPTASADGARAALIVREAAKQMKNSFLKKEKK